MSFYEKEMKGLIDNNQLLLKVQKFYQVNLARISK
jgi:hypothetical protein